MDGLLDVEADPLDAHTLAAIFAGEYRVIHCPDPARALEAARRHEAALVILDIDLPGADGFALLEALARIKGGPPVIVHSARSDAQSVVRAMRAGAADFLEKPAALHDLRKVFRRARGSDPGEGDPFVGTSLVLRRALDLLRRYAPSELPVLILGESGTGKELAAQAIHELSPRQKSALIARNCAALPSELIESELFGSNRGAFTGALDRPGAFELAEGGTLFLDEIGEAGPSVQAKLLRVLESGEIWRLGGREKKRVDVRLVTATSSELRSAAAKGSFRVDLLYRINTLVLELPPLRQRREDIADLATHFIGLAAPGRKHLGQEALSRLIEEEWPGNIRQLRNVVLRAIVLSGDREEILAEDIEV